MSPRSLMGRLPPPVDCREQKSDWKLLLALNPPPICDVEYAVDTAQLGFENVLMGLSGSPHASCGLHAFIPKANRRK